MRLFVSYARVDQRFCTQIVEILGVHDLWFDQRLYPGVEWWDEILRRLDWCEGFVHLLSPESVASEYCEKELRIALKKHKHIFPVLIQPGTILPPELMNVQYVDMSKGLTIQAVTHLLNSIVVAERKGQVVPALPTKSVPNGTAALMTAPTFRPDTFIVDVAEAFEAENWDQAVFLLRTALRAGFQPKFIDIEKMLARAEEALETKSYMREATREYGYISSLVNRKKTRELGCAAFRKFRQQYPDYDPDGIATVCSTVMVPMLQWCDIPAGQVKLSAEKRKVIYHVDSVRMSKYPITIAQFKMFAEADDGYSDSRWWDFDPKAKQWRKLHPEPMPPHVPWGDHPRTNVSWYEAVAFCNWLSAKTGMRIGLPTEPEWQRAAQGDTQNFYPWGNQFSKSDCNTRESDIRTSTSVTRYPNGESPYGVMDMAGNVWEWCRDVGHSSSLNGHVTEDPQQIIRGGSYLSPFKRARLNFSMKRKSTVRYASIGFRVTARPGEKSAI